MPHLKFTCPICFKEHNGYTVIQSAIRLADLPCSTECYDKLMNAVYSGPPKKKQLSDAASAPASLDVHRGAKCKNFNVTAETCRCGVDADQSARNPAVRLGVVRGNVCPLDGVADIFNCPEYK